MTAPDDHEAMRERAVDLVWNAMDDHGHNGIECRAEFPMDYTARHILDALLAAGWRDDGDARVERARAEAWDEAVGHVAQVALVGSAGLNDECFESNPYRAALDGGTR